MGKNHRHKKQLKSEKAKIKLKSTKTKFLPKGLNDTDTSFKVKPIVLQEQLREKASDIPLSKRKLNVKELLTRLKHYNENVRSGACEELTEFITVFSKEIIQSHLSEILQTASTLMQDLSAKVRKACAKVLGTLLEHTPTSKISPFFNYLLRNLCCAITNIDKKIQEDSLLFLDVLLKHAPNLVAENCNKILQNFFALVSKLRADSNVERTLTVNLGSKMTSVRWRIKVLSKLYQILNTVIQNEKNSNTLKQVDDFMIIDGNKTCLIPLYKKSNFDNFIHFNERESNSNSGTKFTDYVVNIVPLLCETWMEVIPAKSHVKPLTESTILNDENVSLLVCILNISYLLYGFIQNGKEFDNKKNIFQSQEGKKFFQHLMQHFPYCCGQRGKSTDAKNEFAKIVQFDIEPKLVKENLIICRLFTAIFLCPYVDRNNTKKNDVKQELKSICAYLSTCINNNFLDNSNVKYYFEILKSALGKESQFWHQAGAKVDAILEEAIKLYKFNKTLNSEHKIELFAILNGVVANKYISRYPIYESWLSFLPILLCQREISQKEVTALQKFSALKNEHFSNSFLANLSKILENLKDLKIDTKELEAKRNIINIIFYLPKLSENHLNVIRNFIRERSTFRDSMLHVLELSSMSERKLKQSDAPFGVRTKRFVKVGFHPELDVSGAMKKEITHVGPGSYDPKYPKCRQSAQSSWKRKVDLEEFSKFLGFRNAHILHQRALYKTLGGPGFSDINEEIFKKKRNSIFENVDFGKGERFHKEENNNPPPGTYSSKFMKQTLYKEGFTKKPHFEWDGFEDRFKQTAPRFHLPCNIYNPKDPNSLDALLKKVVSKRGPYDLFTGPRDDSTIRNHFATPKFKPPDAFFLPLSSMETLLKKRPKYGKFFRANRFGKQFLSVTDPNNPAPNHYDLSGYKGIKTLRPNGISNFGTSCTFPRPTLQWELSPGPGRYNPKLPKCLKAKRQSWIFVSKSQRDFFDLPEEYNAL